MPKNYCKTALSVWRKVYSFINSWTGGRHATLAANSALSSKRINVQFFSADDAQSNYKDFFVAVPNSLQAVGR
jgi:hypothetical protein